MQTIEDPVSKLAEMPIRMTDDEIAHWRIEDAVSSVRAVRLVGRTIIIGVAAILALKHYWFALLGLIGTILALHHWCDVQFERLEIDIEQFIHDRRAKT